MNKRLKLAKTKDGEVWVVDQDGHMVATFRVRTKSGSMNAGLNLDLAKELIGKLEKLDYE